MYVKHWSLLICKTHWPWKSPVYTKHIDRDKVQCIYIYFFLRWPVFDLDLSSTFILSNIEVKTDRNKNNLPLGMTRPWKCCINMHITQLTTYILLPPFLIKMSKFFNNGLCSFHTKDCRFSVDILGNLIFYMKCFACSHIALTLADSKRASDYSNVPAIKSNDWYMKCILEVKSCFFFT